MESCCFTYLGAHFSLTAPASGPLITDLSEANLKSLIASYLEDNYITTGEGPLEGRMHLIENHCELSGGVANIQALRVLAGHEAGSVHRPINITLD